MTSATRRVLCVTLLLLSLQLAAADKTVHGLVFTRVQGAKKQPRPCISSLSLWQEPDPYFNNLKMVKAKRAVRFLRNGEPVQSFPAEVKVVIDVSPDAALVPCNVPPFDPGKLKVKAVWRTADKSGAADGFVTVSQTQAPVPWCENQCSGYWVYELHLDSSGVPLTDYLDLRVDSEKGVPIAEFTGAVIPGPAPLIELSKFEP